jgi:D-xylose transport system ATP-binding protein
MAAILEMRSITKEFPGVRALSEVSLRAERGQTLAIVGQNGAGKSTLMKVLSGAYPRHSYTGSILVDGAEQRFDSPADSERQGIAMIYQEISVHLDMPIGENLFLGRWPAQGGRVDWRRLFAKARESLDELGLDIDPRRSARTLSVSEQQLLNIAKALARKPKILVLDEPTSALTETESRRLFEILATLKDRGIANILISHKLDEVFANADRLVVMRDGATVGEHERNDFDPGRIVSEMVGREMKDLYPRISRPIGEVVLRAEGYEVRHPYNPDKKIVDGVGFELHRSEILGIAGLVGSGRSELVGALFGKIPKRSGRLWLDGRPIAIRGPRDAVRAGLALVTEDRKADGFVGVMSVKENMTMASLRAVSRAGGIDRGRESGAAQRYFESLAVKAPGLDSLLETLSGGNQQKIVLGKWLMTEPRVLILDEPTRGIDVGAKYEIYKIMNELAGRGIAILMISSELPELISMSDRVLVLAGGKIRGEFEADSCSMEDIMHLATGGDGAEAPQER